MKLVRISAGKRCPACGAPVVSIFYHVDECPPEPEGGYPAETYLMISPKSRVKS